MIRVAFAISYGESTWMGGIRYISNLIEAVRRSPKSLIEPVIFLGRRADRNIASHFPGTEIVRTPLLDLFGPYWAISKFIQILWSKNLLFERLLVRNKISILSHSGDLGAGSSIPSIGWIPDFQHIYLPGFFSKREIGTRNRIFRQTCRFCDAVIVSSRDAKNHLSEFSPACAGKARVLHFTPVIADDLTLPPLKDLEDRYEFKGPYLYVPNQFWVHKNHKVILEALQILKTPSSNVQVLCTGSTNDYRMPNFFPDLMSMADRLGVRADFKVLGTVPYVDVLALMRHSVCVLNASLFEGWSTTVEEAKSMGKQIILSDIPVHREQNPERAMFFDPANPKELAKAIRECVRQWNPEEERVCAKRAHERQSGRTEAFASTYEEIVLQTLEKPV